MDEKVLVIDQVTGKRGYYPASKVGSNPRYQPLGQQQGPQTESVVNQPRSMRSEPSLSTGQRVAKGAADLLPALLGIGGGIGGGIAGAPSGPGAFLTGAAGTAAGTGAGIAAKRGAYELAGIPQGMNQKELAMESVVDPSIAGALDLLTAGTMKIAGSVGGAGIRTLGKVGLSEGGKAGEKAFQEAVAGTGSEIFDEVTKRGLTGGVKNLLKQANKQLDINVEGSILQQLYSTARKIKDPVPLDEMIGLATSRADDLAVGESERRTISNVVEDFIQGEGSRINDWGDVINLRTKLNNELKGKGADKMTSGERKFLASMRESLYEFIPKQIADLTKEEQFYIRLRDAVTKEGAKKGVSKAELGFALGGGGLGFLAGGPAVGAATGVGSAFLPSLITNPRFTTNVAKAGKKIAGPATTAARGLVQLLRNSVQ